MREIDMKVSSKIMATAAALAMGSFVATAGNAGWDGPQGGGYHSNTTVKSSAVSASGGLAVKHHGTEVSLALQYNKSQVEAKAGKAKGAGAADASAGSTAETKSSSKGGGYGGGYGGGPSTASSVGGGGYGGGDKGCGCGGTSASSEGTSAASASVGG
jgi:hypothetical protein